MSAICYMEINFKTANSMQEILSN